MYESMCVRSVEHASFEMALSRHEIQALALLFSAGVMLVSLGLALVFNYKYLDVIEETIFRVVYL